MNATRAEALIRKLVAASSAPELDDDDVADLVAAARRPDAAGNAPDGYPDWRALHAVATGALVVPATRNGHVYRATVGGTTGVSAPIWPTSAGATVTDGGVTWQEAGAAPWTPTWNTDVAAALGWERKAGYAAGAFDFSASGESYTRSQTLRHCQEMAAMYRRRGAQYVDVVISGQGAASTLGDQGASPLDEPGGWPQVWRPSYGSTPDDYTFYGDEGAS